jgi:hypothetical protein
MKPIIVFYFALIVCGYILSANYVNLLAMNPIQMIMWFLWVAFWAVIIALALGLLVVLPIKLLFFS